MGRSESSLISVILPVYNGARTLERAITSIQMQQDVSWELIVLDDGSTDESGAIARRIAQTDRRIHVIQRPHRGLVPALKEACTWAQGEFLARMDGDDVASPQRLAAQCAWFEAHPQGGLCGTQVRMAGEAVGIGRQRYGQWLNALLTPEAIDREIFIECPIAHPTFMIKRSVFEAVGGYREFGGPEDYDLVFRIWHGGFPMGNVNRPLLDWYEVPGRLSMTSRRYAEDSFRSLKRSWLKGAAIIGSRPLYQWGAGAVGKRWLREWQNDEIEAVVDIRPGKIGQRIHNVAVIRPEALPPPGACFFLIAVGSPGARHRIRAWCDEGGYKETKDYRFIA